MAEMGEGCLKYIIWSLFWHPRSVFMLSLNFTALGFAALRPISGIKLGELSSLLLYHFLEISSQKQKCWSVRVFSGC